MSPKLAMEAIHSLFLGGLEVPLFNPHMAFRMTSDHSKMCASRATCKPQKSLDSILNHFITNCLAIRRYCDIKQIKTIFSTCNFVENCPRLFLCFEKTKYSSQRIEYSNLDDYEALIFFI